MPDEYARLTGFDGRWRETWWREDFLQLISRRFEFQNAESVLDVGCGAGHWGRTLSRVLSPTTLLAGIDIEESFVNRSKELGMTFGLQSMDYRIGDVKSIPFQDNHFDLVTCQTVLIHVSDPHQALKEMWRVLKPGGSLLLAEPNNLTWYFNFLMAEPRPDWEIVQMLIDFYRTCLLGKKKLGMGDSSIGEYLPSLVAKAEFGAIQVAVNENCPTLVPPYSNRREEVEIQFLKNCIQSSAWMGFGPRDNSLRFFEAGGGNESAFSDLWEAAMQVQHAVLAAIEAQTYAGGRGAMMYLIGAKKLT